MQSPAEPIAFGALVVDARAFTVTRDGVRIDLEPKAFDLLALLIERRGELVTKQEILDRIWKDTAVTDNALTRIVAQLRKAIGDTAREARYLETVPTRGYRWIAEPSAMAVVDPSNAEPSAALVSDPTVAQSLTRRRALSSSSAVAAAIAVCVTLAFIVTRGERRDGGAAPDVAVLRTSQVTVSRGLDAFPAFAPDSRTIAFASDRTGAFELYTRALDVAAAERAITDDRQQNVQPSWSPDGARIAYHSMARGGIWVVPASGGAPRQIVSFGSHPQWSPDGSRIAFQSDPLTDVTPMAFGAMAPSTIWIAGVDSGAPRELTHQPRPTGGHSAPTWSPDGRRVLFVSHGNGPAAIWTVPAGGGSAIRLFVSEKYVFEPQISADGLSLYAATGTAFVLRLPLAADGLSAAGDPQWLATPGLTASRHLRVSRDGQRLVVDGLTLRSTLVSLALDPRSGAPTGEPSLLADDESRRKTSPVFSPDGRHIAFTASRGGSGPDVWIFDTDTRRESPITASDRADTAPAAGYFRPSWFPGGTRVGFLKTASGGLSFSAASVTERREAPVLTIFSADRDAEDPATELSGSSDFSLSPDGTTLAYSGIVRATGLPRLFARPIAGGDPRPLAEGTSVENFPAWSPDGRWIAFELGKDASTNLAVVSASGGIARQVTFGAGQHWVHSWAPDNDRVAIARQKDGVWNIWSVSVSTGDSRLLTAYTAPSAHVRYPAWSPRGDRIVYEYGDVRGNIWVSRLAPR